MKRSTRTVLLMGGLLAATACGGNEKEKETEITEVEEVIAPRDLTVTNTYNPDNLPLDRISLPEGFEISVFAAGIEDARSLALGENGTVFVGNRSADKVYAVVDENKDGVADQQYVIASDLNMPNGVAFRDGDLYVAEVNRILRFPDIEANLANPPEPEVVYDNYPTDRSHGWKYISFGPDGKLYVPVGAPCNNCVSEKDEYATITRMNPDGSNMEVFAEGVRNSVGFDWHPETDELWFTENGRDMLGNNLPPDELNRAPEKGLHFGFPYCHAGEIPDPEFGEGRSCEEFVAPAQNLGPHVAPLGMKFYTGNMFPESFRNQILIPEHGSWNRDEKIGYRIQKVNVAENGNATSYETFADGWLNEETQEAWGRPVALLELPDGSLLVSDDHAGVIYRITYEG